MKRMPRWLAALLAFGSLAVVAGAVVFYYITQKPDSDFTKTIIIPVMKPLVGFISGLKPHENVAEATPDFIFTTDTLQHFFKKNEQEAAKTYNGKIVQVKGAITQIASPTDTNIVILLAIESDPVSNISCQMDATFNDRMKGLTAGSTVSIKGICNGAKKDDLFGMLDILLNRCVIVQ